MKILFVGDSITQGSLGESFVNKIKLEPNVTITNLGCNGDTMLVVFQKLMLHLDKKSDYDIVVIQGGYNDLLLPYFKEKSKIFQMAADSQIKRGIIPTSFENWENLLKTNIQKVKELFSGKIILVNIGCLGENLTTALNQKRENFNKIIQKIVTEENLFLADIQQEFDGYLKDKKAADYCLDSFWAVTVFDYLRKSRRNLFLTIDGVHLNNKGAELVANCLKPLIV